jgi:hypothetical protein
MRTAPRRSSRSVVTRWTNWLTEQARSAATALRDSDADRALSAWRCVSRVARETETAPACASELPWATCATVREISWVAARC